MYSIGQLAKKFNLSRSTLLYYDKIGLLEPANHVEGDYRHYSAKDARRLEQICQFRQVGLPLKEIKQVLDAPKTKLAGALENRLIEINSEIDRLRDQQNVIVALLQNPKSHKRINIMNKEVWVSLLEASGFNEEDMTNWHIEFERQSPDKHQKFLEFLCIPQDEILHIRSHGKSSKQ
jgi:DNA-binding transcriptional MerR regulator